MSVCRTVDHAAEPGSPPLRRHGVPQGQLEAGLLMELLVKPLDGLIRLAAPRQLWRSTKQHVRADLMSNSPAAACFIHYS